MKNIVCIIIGVMGSGIIGIFGGWDTIFSTLVIFMIFDYVTGLLVAATGNSPKSKTGGLNSYVGLKGIAKKIMILFLVAVGYRIDLIMGMDYLRNTVIIAFSANEAISITENAGLIGIPIPKIILHTIDVLKENIGEEEINEKNKNRFNRTL